MVVEEAAPEGYAVVKYLGKRYKVRLAKPTTAKSLLKAISKNYLRNTNPATLVLHTEFETTLGRDDLVHPGWTLRCRRTARWCRSPRTTKPAGVG